MSDDRFQEIISRLLDDELSGDELAELAELAKDRPSRQQEIQSQLEAAEMICLSEDVLRDSSLFISALQSRILEDPFVSRIRSEMKLGDFGRARRAFIPWAIATAAVIALVASSLLLKDPKSSPSTIAEIVEVNGAVQWTGDGGKVEVSLAKGRLISGGTLESLSHDSWAMLEFIDGTSVTLSGQSAVTISEDQQKVLHLRQGNLSSDVTSQPVEHPMLVHTPTAELQVLGTQFNVVAQPDTTMLTVNEGRVRMKRLTDGKLVNVPADHLAIASLDAQNGLAATPRSAGVSAWQSDLERDVIHGKWASGLDRLGKQLKKAVASGVVSEAEAIDQFKQAVTLNDRGSVWASPSAFGNFVLLRVSGWSPAPVVAKPQSKFRVRGKLYKVTSVAIGFSADAPNGGFAGKYTTTLTAADLPADGNEFDVTLSVNQFITKDSRFDASPSGKLIRDFWSVTKSKKAKFEITHLELIE